MRHETTVAYGPTGSTFGDLLRQRRLTAGLTQESLAERAGLSVHGIQKIERGITRPYRDTVQRLLLALRIPPGDEAEFLAAAQPAPRPMARRRESDEATVGHNLPAAVTSFIGRSQDLVEIRTRLADARLLTLTGVGGCGKTRLGLELARAVLDEYEDGVWLIELGPLTDPALVASEVAAVVGVRETAGQSATTALVAAVRAQRLLLVLDNCEHLLDVCARLVDTLVRSCPDLRIVATSREPLGIAGEVVWRVPSLATPDPDQLPPLAELEQTPAIQLFIERARAVEPHFALTGRNAAAMATICKRLDGIPLALELAAARVRALTVEQLLARLDQRFRLLTGGSRSAMPRQKTLQATLDWSYELLEDRERALFRRLAVFAGGWTLEAAEAVAEAEPIASGDVLDLLTSLIDKSLVLTDARGPEERYSFLETVRQYAEDQLLRAGETAAARDRHRTWCLRLRPLSESDSREQRKAVAAELDNLRTALGWCAIEDATSGLTLMSRFGRAWHVLGGTRSESRRWLETFLDRAPEPTAIRADALLDFGHHLRWFHEFTQAGRASDEALAISTALADEGGIAAAMAALGLVAANQGDYARAWRYLDEALASARLRGDVGAVARFLRDLGVTCIAAGEFDRARTALAESANLAPRGSLGEVVARIRLAILDRLEGDHERARGRLLEVGLSTYEEFGGWSNLARLEYANQARAVGQFDEARAGIIDVLGLGHQEAALVSSHEMLAMLGICEIAAGACSRGVTLLAAASNVEGPIGTVHMPDVRVEAPMYLERARAALGEADYASAWAEGTAMSLDQVLTYALETNPDGQVSSSGTAIAHAAVGT